MRIKFYAHACFRLEANGLVVITDPYTPGPGHSGFDPIEEAADVVMRERVAGHDAAMWREEFPLMVAWAFGG